ncbi:MAG TPA: hypothetical protein PLE99_10140 [Candidatus Thiothrix moscowensis]|uniref:hypothetical protein n=1 Tax=Thiothrix sp. UBA2016 TaxID=1947695 RepID=UPI0025F9BD96|nr:hypothetical protein [Thiothrix sp. UBA2016]HRJ53119.1 hypothetical protein [Candidatus Thiothrix moscowensis]HRJ93110.1 hypothetical protein [Candidatus Thiothrix moscowensis]
MLKGIHLTLLVGSSVPVPVPQEVLDALTSVQVTSASGETESGFELQFTLSNRSPLHTIFLLAGGNMIPFMRVVIVVTLNSTPQVLMDGVMLNTTISPGSDSAHSVLTVKGKDLSAVMSYIDFTGVPYPAMPTAAVVLLILSKYAALGVIPLVIPPIVEDLPIPTERFNRHKGNDLDQLRLLADDAGYVFYIEPGPLPGTSTAYFGPQIKAGVPQPALTINMDAHTNIESLQFSYDKETKITPIIYFHEEKTKAPIGIPIPDISPLNPPLGLIPPVPPKLKSVDIVFTNPLRGVMFGLAEASRTADAVTGQGSLNVLRYGHILKSRKLVGVRGVGLAFDGLYYVSSVTHNIKPGEYKQSFELKRNGLLPTIPRVLP